MQSQSTCKELSCGVEIFSWFEYEWQAFSRAAGKVSAGFAVEYQKDCRLWTIQKKFWQLRASSKTLRKGLSTFYLQHQTHRHKSGVLPLNLRKISWFMQFLASVLRKSTFVAPPTRKSCRRCALFFPAMNATSQSGNRIRSSTFLGLLHILKFILPPLKNRSRFV